MTDANGGAPPALPAQRLPTDVGIGLMCIDLAGSMLTQMVQQCRTIGQQSPTMQEIAKVLESLVLHLSATRQEIVRQALGGLVIAGPGDVPPPRRLQ